MNDIPYEKMPGFAAVAPVLAGAKPYDFSFVHSFTYTEEEDAIEGHWRNITLVMADDSPAKKKVGFRFERVADVSFSGFGQIMGMYVQSVVDRGWEGLRFEVGDYEDQKIHFFCHSIRLFAVEETPNQPPEPMPGLRPAWLI
ncbi:MAG: hypothetical protein NTV51_08740 [Verrucomicrobia bacterium]|nr:hypothetical protein [Verrucomicrobiota bacterium]